MTIGSITLAIIIILIYFAPTIKAVQEKKKNRDAIMLVNLFLGWTFFGWLIALVWAYSKD